MKFYKGIVAVSIFLISSTIFAQGGSTSFSCKYYTSEVSSSWTYADSDRSSCFSFLSATFYVRKAPTDGKRYYKIEINNSSKQAVTVGFKWEHEKSGGRTDAIPPNGSFTSEGLITDLRYISVDIYKVRFSYSDDITEQYGKYESDYLDCYETAYSVINKLEKEKKERDKENRIRELKRKIGTYDNDVESLEEKLNDYEELEDLEVKNYHSEKNDIKKQLNELRHPSNKSSKSKSSSSSSKNKKKKKKKKKEEKEEEEEYDYNKERIRNMSKASDLYNKLSRTYNPAQRRIILRELEAYSYYLTPSQRAAYNREVRDNQISDSTAKIATGLTSIDYGDGIRHVLFYGSTGINAISGNESDQSVLSFPTVKAGIEVTIPLSRKFALDFMGSYHGNFFLNLPESEPEPSVFPGFEPVDIPETMEDVTLTRFTYGLGFTLGSRRGLSFALLANNMKYNQTNTYDGEVDFEIGDDETITTYGIGLGYNFKGKEKQELFRIMGSYTINDENLSFISEEYENNKQSNLNFGIQVGFGAFLIAAEYNIYEDKITDLKIQELGFRLGFKIGV